MNNAELRRSYFAWMCQLVYSPQVTNPDGGYERLLAYLDSVKFRYVNPLDANRESDGIKLRNHYAYFHGMRYDDVHNSLGTDGCSILELMVSLACKCEDIMSDATKGNRTAQWFWEMVSSLGLSGYVNSHFDEDYISMVIAKFMANDYRPDGFGGLFYIPGFSGDMRMADIWTQMHFYLNYHHNETTT